MALKLVASAQITLMDLNDAIIAGSAPSSPVDGTLWLDSSVTPNILKKWNAGTSHWDTQTMDLSNLDPTADGSINSSAQKLLDMASDSVLSQSERIAVKADIAQMTGIVPASNMTVMPTGTSLDVGLVGDYYNARAQAVSAGVSTSHADYTGLASAYTTLATYLNGLTPYPWDTTSTTSTPITATTWNTDWNNYYNALDKLNATTQAQQATNSKSGGRNLIHYTAAISDNLNHWHAWNGTTLGDSLTTVTLASGESLPMHTIASTTGQASGTVFALQSESGSDRFAVVSGRQYTLSFLVAVSNADTNLDYTYLICEGGTNQLLATDAVTNHPTYGTFTSPVSATVYSYSITFTANAGCGTCRVLIGSKTNSTNQGFVYISNIKLEEGTKATGWSPAPEDINGNTITSMINQTATTITISASKIALQGNVTFDLFDANTKAAVSADGSIINNNPYFMDWPSTLTYPTGYQSLTYTSPSSVAKVTDNSQKGYIVQYVVASGVNTYLNPNQVTNYPYTQYLTCTTTFRLDSGSLDGSGVLCRVNATANIDNYLNFKTLVPSPVIGKWYTVTQTFKLSSPLSPAGFSGYTVYPMGGYSVINSVTAKTISFSEVELRPSTDQEINAYEATNNIRLIADTSNLAPNPMMDGGSFAFYTQSSGGVLPNTDPSVPTGAPTQYVGWQNVRDNYGSNFFPVNAGDKYYVEFWAAGTSDVNYTFGIGMNMQTVSGTNTWPVAKTTTIANCGTWTMFSGTVTVPASYVKGRLFLQIQTSSDPVAGKWFYTLVKLRRVNDANTVSDTQNVAGTPASTVRDNASNGASAYSTVTSNQSNWNTAFNSVNSWTTAGKTTINGGMIETNTIKASQIAIGDFTNYASWESKGTANTSPWASTAVVDTSTYHTAVASLKLAPGASSTLGNQIAVMSGDSIYWEFWVKTDSTFNGTSNNSKFRIGDQSNTLLTATGYNGVHTSWTFYSGTYTVGSSTTSLQISLNSDATTGNVWLDDILIVKQNSGKLIVNGSIVASHIKSLNGLTISNGVGTQFAVDASGNVSLSGSLSGATGTFAGSLSAATGTFAGSLSAASGTFSGSLSSASGTFTGSLSEGSTGNNAIITQGTIKLTQSSGTYLIMTPSSFIGYTSGGAVSYRMDSTMVTSSAFGTTVANVYLGAQSGGEARVVDMNGIPGDGVVSSYTYLNMRANGYYGNFLDVGTNPDNIYVRPYSTGELRVTNTGSTTSYRPARMSALFADSLDNNTGSSLYIRPNGGSVQCTSTGSTTNYVVLQASNVYAASIEINGAMASSTGLVNLYLKPASGGSVYCTVAGGTTTYVPLHASNLYADSLDCQSSSAHMYIRPTSGNHVTCCVTGTAGSSATYVPVLASAFTVSSKVKHKTNIEELRSARDIIKQGTVHSYDLKVDFDYVKMGKMDKVKKRFGFIIGEGYSTPEEIIGTAGEGIDLYSMGALTWRATQEQQEEIEEQREEIKSLRDEVAELKQMIKALMK